MTSVCTDLAKEETGQGSGAESMSCTTKASGKTIRDQFPSTGSNEEWNPGSAKVSGV